MELVSVNIGTARTQPKGQTLETTGIYKTPVSQPVQIGTLGIAEDAICDHKNHGGPDQAVYVYGVSDYEWWSRALGRPLEWGTFGENLTISDLESASFRIGDRLQIGGLVLQVSAPRIPCGTLARRMRDPLFVKKYRRAERPGLYCRVLQEAAVQVGLPVSVEPYSGENVSVLEVFREYYRRPKDPETLRRLLRAPLAIRAREDTERDLENLLASS